MKQRTVSKFIGPGVPLMQFSNDPAPQSLTSTPAASSPGTSTTQTTRNIREIDVDLIDPNPLAPREVYTSQMVRSLADALADQGQHDPIHVFPNPDALGRFIICDGWTRVQACRKHGVLGGKLLAEIHQNLTFQESAWFGYQQNEGRSQHFDIDRGLFYAKLIKSGQSQTEIARRAKLSKTLMSFYLSYHKLPESVLDVVRDRPERFGATAAWHLSKFLEKFGSDATLILALQFAEEMHSVRWLAAQTRATTPADHPTKAAAQIRTVTYANGMYKMTEAQCELLIDLKNVSPAMRSIFTIELEKLIEMVTEKT